MSVKNPQWLILQYAQYTQRSLLYIKWPLTELCIAGYAWIFSIRMLENWGFWQIFLHLKWIFAVHFYNLWLILTKWYEKSYFCFVILMTKLIISNFNMVNYFIQCFEHYLIFTETNIWFNNLVLALLWWFELVSLRYIIT